ncbi:transmembrane protein 127 isoform X2 [Mustela putorius furo]|uniref:Transmembrane protein 127 isoform X2 n=1 Tax=Mustela putorius furo TaxID=9669 RepID=A0A8U0V1B0_MUSPF|nr:transmembrane protein 127 isoform X2 [Mustela putorius furo]
MRRDTSQQHQRVLHGVPEECVEEVGKGGRADREFHGAKARDAHYSLRPPADPAASAGGPGLSWELRCPLLRPCCPLGVVVSLPRLAAGTARQPRTTSPVRPCARSRGRAQAVTRAGDGAGCRRRRRQRWRKPEVDRARVGPGVAGLGPGIALPQAAAEPVTERSGAIPALRPADRFLHESPDGTAPAGHCRLLFPGHPV